MRYVRYAVEGPTDEAVAETLLKSAGLIPRHTLTTYGKDYLDRKLPGLNRTASTLAWFVIRDLDHESITQPRTGPGAFAELRTWLEGE